MSVVVLHYALISISLVSSEIEYLFILIRHLYIYSFRVLV